MSGEKDGDTFVQRLLPVIGKPVATMFVEEGSARHLIIEITVSTVVAYLGGKFLDGFVDGLGITDLGKTIGQDIRRALASLGELIVGEQGGQSHEHELQVQTAVLQKAADRLTSHASNAAALRLGERAVENELQDKGLPPSEARRIAQLFAANMLPGHG